MALTAKGSLRLVDCSRDAHGARNVACQFFEPLTSCGNLLCKLELHCVVVVVVVVEVLVAKVESGSRSCRGNDCCGGGDGGGYDS